MVYRIPEQKKKIHQSGLLYLAFIFPTISTFYSVLIKNLEDLEDLLKFDAENLVLQKLNIIYQHYVLKQKNVILDCLNINQQEVPN